MNDAVHHDLGHGWLKIDIGLPSQFGDIFVPSGDTSLEKHRFRYLVPPRRTD